MSPEASQGTTAPGSPEALARLFHETYERLAPEHGYQTRKASAVPWEDVPAANKNLMIAVAAEVGAAHEAMVETGDLRERITLAIMGRTAPRAADAVLAELGYGIHRCVRCDRQQAKEGEHTPPICPPCLLLMVRDAKDAQIAEQQAETEHAEAVAASLLDMQAAENYLKVLARAEDAEAERDRLREAVERVREIHEEIPCECTKCRNRREQEWGCPDEVCKACSIDDGASGAVVWPCPTIAALDQETTEEP